MWGGGGGGGGVWDKKFFEIADSKWLKARSKKNGYKFEMYDGDLKIP